MILCEKVYCKLQISMHNETGPVKLQTEEKKEKRDDFLYMNILKDIRDMNVLSSYQIHYLRQISQEKIIYLIEIYNKIIQNVNEVL
jgi:hypothetical protein